MRKEMRNTFACLAFAALVLSSCGDAIEIPDVAPPDNGQDVPPPDDNPLSGDIIFTATAENLPDGSAFNWTKGSQIMLYDGSVARTLTNTAERGVIARFPATLTGEEKGFLALCPASEDAQFSHGKITVQMPAARQTDAATTAYMAARSSGNLLYFRHLSATIVIPVGVDGITKIRLQSSGGEKIAGEVTFDLSGDAPVVTATENHVELSGEFVKGQRYSVLLTPGKLSGYSIIAYKGETELAHVNGGETTLPAGSSLTLDSIGQDIPTYRITNLWLWGGTGPEYDCTKVYDLFAKSNCFNNNDGRGVNALKDNYIELRPNGTVMNWAGADGRNWWYVYNGSMNPETGKDLDLSGFYEVIPRGEGTYTVSGASITFNWTGHASTCQVVPAGTYNMPGTTPVKTVTIAEGHFALKFTISGGKDNWSHTYDDYGVFACQPRVLFIEVEQMPAGFSTPDASRTTDTDFAFESPVDPGTSFDWDHFAGDWTVYGGNSEPYGFFVLGGSGNDPAFLSPVAKYWDWNNSVKNESDNGLVVTVTSRTDTEIKGTTNWWAGNDDAFWDYQWIKTTPATDLSGFYDKIPKGVSEYTINLATLEITLGNGEKAKILAPGTHTFTGTSAISFAKTLEVPDGCFALDFHLMDPIPGTSDRWTDVDRFINAPLEYVIIFEK